MKHQKMQSIVLAVCISTCLFTLSSCWPFGNDDDEVVEQSISIDESFKKIDLYCGDTKEIIITSGSNIEWRSENEFIAKWESASSFGHPAIKVKGNHVGTTRIVGKNDVSTVEIIVRVLPKIEMYDSPITEFGISKASLMSKETHRLMTTADEGNDLAYDYSSSKWNVLMGYVFDHTNDMLTDILCIVAKKDKSVLNEEDVSSFVQGLGERFGILTSGGEPYSNSLGVIFVEANGVQEENVTTAIHVKPAVNGFVLLYHEYKDKYNTVNYSGVNTTFQFSNPEEAKEWAEFWGYTEDSGAKQRFEWNQAVPLFQTSSDGIEKSIQRLMKK